MAVGFMSIQFDASLQYSCMYSVVCYYSNKSSNLIGCVNGVASVTTLPNIVRYVESPNECG